LLGSSQLDQASKEKLRQERIFLEPETVVMGNAGFISPSKGTDMLYHAHEVLQQMLPGRKIAAVRVGFLREPDNSIDSACAAELRARRNRPGQFFLETYLPRDVLPVLLRALDIYFYWPSDSTQSGIVAHSLGVGATIACRDMEGVGETVKMAGGLACVDFEQAIAGLRELALHPKLRKEMSRRAMRYAEEFSWRSQASRHFGLADQLRRSVVQGLVSSLPLATSADQTEKPSLAMPGEIPSTV